MHLTLEEFETYLTTTETTQETLNRIAPLQAHLDSCTQCRDILSKLSHIHQVTDDEILSLAAPLLSQESAIRNAIAHKKKLKTRPQTPSL